MYQLLALDFNNEDICVKLPDEAEDLDDFELLEPNNMSRISIHCDCKNIAHFLLYK